MPEEEEYYYYDDDRTAYDVGVYIAENTNTIYRLYIRIRE